MVFNLVVTLVARLDLQILRHSSGDERARGEYKAAQAIATIPYQAVFAITFVLFPLVSGAAARDPERIRTYDARVHALRAHHRVAGRALLRGRARAPP